MNRFKPSHGKGVKHNVICARLPGDLAAKIAHLAEQLEISKSDFVLQALEFALENLEDS